MRDAFEGNGVLVLGKVILQKMEGWFSHLLDAPTKVRLFGRVTKTGREDPIFKCLREAVCAGIKEGEKAHRGWQNKNCRQTSLLSSELRADNRYNWMCRNLTSGEHGWVPSMQNKCI